MGDKINWRVNSSMIPLLHASIAGAMGEYITAEPDNIPFTWGHLVMGIFLVPNKMQDLSIVISKTA